MKELLISFGKILLAFPVPILLYAFLVNLSAFVLYGIDKRKAIRHRYRIPEATLLLFSFFGGGMGSLIGMTAFRHKTKHTKFLVLVPILFLVYTTFFVLSLIFALLSLYGT